MFSKRLYLSKYVIITFLAVIISPVIKSQTESIKEIDLSQIKVNELSDQQINNYVQQAQAAGFSLDQLEAIATARGMPQSEIINLRRRIDSLQYKLEFGAQDTRIINRTRSSNFGKEQVTGNKTSLIQRMQDEGKIGKTNEELIAEKILSSAFLIEKKKTLSTEDKLFGYSLFNNERISFEPSLNLPTPKNYILGPGDEVIIDVWGASENTYRHFISPEGSILINNIGPIYLAGLSVEEATKRVKHSLSIIYSGLKEPSPNTFMSLTLGQIRSIKVNLAGEVKVPGTYTLPAVATVLNALYAAGGPSLNGTLRNVKLIRNNNVIAEIDFYTFLLKGILPDNLRLEDQDVIFVASYSRRVEINGEVKRPGIYDLTDKEALKDLISYTGGFTGKAYREKIKVIRMNGREKEIYDVKMVSADSFSLTNGDQIIVDSVLNRFANIVEIRGAVFREGFYSLGDSLTLKELIAKAEGLRGDAFLNRAVIYRTRKDFSVEVIPVDLNEFFSENVKDIPLQRDDFVLVPSHFDITEEYTVQIEGEIKKPGLYPYVRNQTVEDLIIQAGGLLESASLSVLEIARRINNPYSLESSEKISEIYRFPITAGLSLSPEASSFVLYPFDHVFIRRSPAYEKQKIVTLNGEFLFPGNYALASKGERISEVISRAGGLTPFAYPEGAKLIRKINEPDIYKMQIIQNYMQSTKDSLSFFDINSRITTIGIELDKILKNPGSDYDLLMMEGDVLEVPKRLETVRLTGAVVYPTTVKFKSSYSFNQYISNAGGFADDANKSKAFVIYPNGKLEKTKRFLVFNVYPSIKPGSEIVVPTKIKRQKASPAETISIASALASISLIIVSIINNVKW